MYKENLIKIGIKTAIGFAVAFFVMTQIEPDWDFGGWCIMAFLFSTVPYGWGTINNWFGSWFITGSAAAIVIGLTAKFLLALLIGWIVTPIALIYNVVMLFLENRTEVME